jgi:Flp pilus assembly protein TadD
MLVKGELQEAEAACRRVLHTAPSDAAATHLLGLVIYQQGCTDDACQLLRHKG